MGEITKLSMLQSFAHWSMYKYILPIFYWVLFLYVLKGEKSKMGDSKQGNCFVYQLSTTDKWIPWDLTDTWTMSTHLAMMSLTLLAKRVGLFFSSSLGTYGGRNWKTEQKAEKGCKEGQAESKLLSQTLCYLNLHRGVELAQCQQQHHSPVCKTRRKVHLKLQNCC